MRCHSCGKSVHNENEQHKSNDLAQDFNAILIFSITYRQEKPVPAWVTTDWPVFSVHPIPGYLSS
jgi:hypothetical protein